MILSKIVDVSHRQPGAERPLSAHHSSMLAFFLNDNCGITSNAKAYHSGIGAPLGQLSLNVLPAGYAETTSTCESTNMALAAPALSKFALALTSPFVN